MFRYIFTKLSILGIIVYILLALNNVVKPLTVEVSAGLVVSIIFIGLLEDAK
jgi:hypothetical protein